VEESCRGLFKDASQHLPEGTEKNHEKHQRVSRSSSRDLNTGYIKHVAVMLTTGLSEGSEAVGPTS
jgi:hypothetical protein